MENQKGRAAMSGHGTGMDVPNTIQLHIESDAMPLGQFVDSVRAFTQMIDALAKDASESASWLISVESGSTCFNAQLVTDDAEALPDVTPVFAVVEKNVMRLSSGEGIDSVPMVARRQYQGLVQAIEWNGRHAAAATFVFGDASAGALVVVPVKDHGRPEPPKALTYSSVGSITGFLYDLNSNRGDVFRIRNEATGLPVMGTYSESLDADFRAAFKTRATVTGIIEYRRDGRIKSIEARSVRVEPKAVPRLSSLRGILEA